MTTTLRAQPLSIAVIHGPNLNLLGLREPELYGRDTLASIDARLAKAAGKLGAKVDCFQSNAEGALIDHVHSLHEKRDGIVINAAALTHTSVGLRDALNAVAIPLVEVHLSNVYTREPFRHISYLSDIALGVICGFGPASYELGLLGLVERLRAGR